MEEAIAKPCVRREFASGDLAVRLVDYPAGYRQARHSHDHHGVSFLIAGFLRESVGRREEAAEPFSLVVKPAGVAHADVTGPAGARLLQIVFETDSRLWRESDIGTRRGWRWMHHAPGLPEMVDLVARLPSGAGAPVAIVEDGVLELLARVAGSAEPRRGEIPAWLRRVKQRLDEDSDGFPRVRRLAEQAGVHPVSLARAFRRHYGMSVTHCRKLARFRRAVTVLAASGHNLSRVAHACGYADHAHFCRDLRGLAGVSPRVIRRLLTSRVSSVQEAGRDGP